MLNKNPTKYDSLVKMMRDEIVNEELIDHDNRTTMILPPLKGKEKEALPM